MPLATTARIMRSFEDVRAAEASDVVAAPERLTEKVEHLTSSKASTPCVTAEQLRFDSATMHELASRVARELVAHVPPAAEAQYFSIPALQKRWSCGETSVYSAIHDMENGGYLQRIYIGRDQRIALRSVEAWERLHSSRPGERPRAVVAGAHPLAVRHRPGRPRKRQQRVHNKSDGSKVSIRELARLAVESGSD